MKTIKEMHTWAARLWQEKEDRSHAFAAVVFPRDMKSPVGFGVGPMAHKALAQACSEIGFGNEDGFAWPDSYQFDETFGRDCIRAENEHGDSAIVYKL